MTTTEARPRSRARAARWRALCRERRFRVRCHTARLGFAWALSQALENLRLVGEWRALAQRRGHYDLWLGTGAGFLVGSLIASALHFALKGI